MSTGTVGDFYIDDTTHAIYGPKRKTTWGRPTDLIGPRGKRGTTGPTGATGAIGQTGKTGDIGATGVSGPTGAEGPPGFSVLHGSGAPEGSAGTDNDFYIDTASTQLYGPKEGGTWGSPVSLTGRANVSLIDGGSL